MARAGSGEEAKPGTKSTEATKQEHTERECPSHVTVKSPLTSVTYRDELIDHTDPH